MPALCECVRPNPEQKMKADTSTRLRRPTLRHGAILLARYLVTAVDGRDNNRNNNARRAQVDLKEPFVET